MSRALETAGLLVMGAVAGLALSLILGATVLPAGGHAIVLLVVFGVAGAATLVTSSWLRRNRDQSRAASDATKRRLLMSVISDGYGVLIAIANWSFENPDVPMTGDEDAAALGALGQAKFELLDRAADWVRDTQNMVIIQFAHEGIAYAGAVPIPPASHVYVHPHLTASYGDVRGKVQWLQDRLTRPMPAPQRVHQQQ